MDAQEEKIRTQNYQKFFSRIFMTISQSYIFKGELEIDQFKHAVDLIYQNDAILSYSCLDENEEIGKNFMKKNTPEFQKTLDEQPKFVHKTILDLEYEINYIHNNSTDFMEYGDNLQIPLKYIALTGYKKDEFCIVVLVNHQIADGTQFSTYFNYAARLYSKLIKNQSTETLVKQLQGRVCLADFEYLKLAKYKFWRLFLNNIKIIKKKTFADPGKFRVQSEEAQSIFEEYANRDKTDFSRNISQTVDMDEIYKLVKIKYPKVSKNSIFFAYIFKFTENFNENVRYKQLGKQPKELKGASTILQNYRSFTQEFNDNHSGMYLGRLTHHHDPSHYKLEDLANKIHQETQENKVCNLPVLNNFVLSQLYGSNAGLKMLSQRKVQVSMVTTNWTNFELNMTPDLMQGCEFITSTGGMSYKAGPLLGYLFTLPTFITYFNPDQRTVTFSLNSPKSEDAKSIMENFKIFHEEFTKNLQKPTNQLIELDGTN